jgi:hypothetical protein
MSLASILKNPANKALFTCPEMLIGLGVLAGIVFGGNELLIKTFSTEGATMDGKIASIKTDIEAKKQFSETLKKLEASGRTARLAFMTVANPELLTVTLFDYTQRIRKSIGTNRLQLPAPHNQITLLSLEETGTASSSSSASPTTSPPPASSTEGATATAEVIPEKLDLHDIKNAPFKFDEAASLKDGKLSVYTKDYTLKVRGTYAGLLSVLSTLFNTSPVISVQSFNFSLDTAAPPLSILRSGAKLIPPPAATTSTIEGSEGAESGSGKGNSVLFSGAGATAEPEVTATPAASEVKLPPSAAPVIMTLNFRFYLKEKADPSATGSSATPSASPSADPASTPAGATAPSMPPSAG